MLDFSEPSHSGRSASRSRPYVARSACASIGSPRAVPVPWPSTTSTSTAESPEAASASWMTRSWERPLGAVSPLDAPSWLTAEPRTTASTWCPLRRASDSRSSSSTPAPSDQPVPSAPAAKDLQRPSPASPRCLLNSTKVSGLAITVTPPSSAMSHSPSRSARLAQCRATSDEEHAVSSVTAGPSSPKAYATRPDTTLAALPVATYPSTSSGTAAMLDA